MQIPGSPGQSQEGEMSATQTAGTVDAGEVAKFEAMAAEWWDPASKFRPLHMLNPCRLDYVVAQVAAEFGRDPRARRPFEGLGLLDVGCGGGLLSEPMARLGAAVTGVDAAAGNIPVAEAHAAQSGLAIDYRVGTAEDLAAAGERFDVLLNMEVVEHVPDPARFLAACRELLKPGGLMVASTINRNPKSWLLAIVGAEHLLRWLPRGTHDWSRFITPDELFGLLREAGLEPVDRKGFVFDPLGWAWRISDRDLSVNYVTTSVRRDA
jgi:2-polyprenyl-6-hydroxyphenyl methylase / 3-demethylubiquinone-9 3-methyltransferase